MSTTLTSFDPTNHGIIKPSSEAVREGRVNIPKSQYDCMPQTHKDTFMPVLANGKIMYRWRGAPPMRVEDSAPIQERDYEDGHDWFKVLVEEFMTAIHTTAVADLVEGDEDEEYTYGAFCTALATMKRSEMDWTLTRAFGDVYELRRVHDSDVESDG